MREKINLNNELIKIEDKVKKDYSKMAKISFPGLVSAVGSASVS